jgi:Na+-transporting NADH:ubiquinone oxidoreductase subunit NqrA
MQEELQSLEKSVDGQSTEKGNDDAPIVDDGNGDGRHEPGKESSHCHAVQSIRAQIRSWHVQLQVSSIACVSECGFVCVCVFRLGKVTSIYMPQRASQRKLGKILKPHLAKQKKQELEETRTRCVFR